ncbi:Facilitated trehalose transporter Tret1, partial [Armadillidium nasatum]
MESSRLGLLSRKTPKRCTQVLATMVVALGPLATGLGKGYSSPALASMQTLSTNSTNTTDFAITPEEGSWIASLSLLGAFFGGLPGGLAMKLGRRRILFIVALPFTLFWFLTVFAKLCSNGLCIFIFMRSLLCNRVIGYSSTPSFLLYRKREKEAEASLTWLRGGHDITRELTTMKANINSMRENEKVSCYKELRRSLIKPILITCGLMVFQKFSGANAFNFYAVPILSQAFVGIDPYSAAVVVALLQILAGMISSMLIDTAGRLPLLIISNILMSSALAGFGTYVYVTEGREVTGAGTDWIPLTCALIFQVAFALGISPVSWLYIGELFPLRHRGLGAIANSVSYACSFASVKTFVDFQLLLGLHGSFWLYSGISVVGLVFTVSLVPETKGRGLEEME